MRQMDACGKVRCHPARRTLLRHRHAAPPSRHRLAEGRRGCARLTLTQDRLLVHALDLLKPGGTLVYAVCSLQEDEGPARVEGLLAREKRLQRVPVEAAELPGLAERSHPQAAYVPCPRCGPSAGGLDGFYVARLRLA